MKQSALGFLAMAAILAPCGCEDPPATPAGLDKPQAALDRIQKMEGELARLDHRVTGRVLEACREAPEVSKRFLRRDAQGQDWTLPSISEEVIDHALARLRAAWSW